VGAEDEVFAVVDGADGELCMHPAQIRNATTINITGRSHRFIVNNSRRNDIYRLLNDSAISWRLSHGGSLCLLPGAGLINPASLPSLYTIKASA
jgi:hypothetical protein